VLSYDVYGEPEDSKDAVEALKRVARNTLEKLEAKHRQLCAKEYFPLFSFDLTRGHQVSC